MIVPHKICSQDRSLKKAAHYRKYQRGLLERQRAMIDIGDKSLIQNRGEKIIGGYRHVEDPEPETLVEEIQ